MATKLDLPGFHIHGEGTCLFRFDNLDLAGIRWQEALGIRFNHKKTGAVPFLTLDQTSAESRKLPAPAHRHGNQKSRAGTEQH
jgi:hypothetical protein